MNLFAQISKVDEEKRLVFGRAVQETVDKSGEIMDYESSKPHFVKWSKDIAEDTEGKSLGNLRAMHGKVAAGKLTAIDFNDAEKAIDVCAKVVDDQEWKKVMEGVYTGFSIGGSYAGNKTVEKVNGEDVTRYTAIPSELSLVDRPCVPSAKFFEVQKSDGTTARVAFAKIEEVQVVEDATVDGTPEQVDELVKVMGAGAINMEKVIGLVKGYADDKKAKDASSAEDAKLTPEEKAAKAKKAKEEAEKAAEAELRKGLDSCSNLSQIICSLTYLIDSVKWEEAVEQDASGISARLSALAKELGGVLVDMTAEEVKELTGGEATDVVLALSQKAGALVKRLEPKVVAVDTPKTELQKAIDTEAVQKMVEVQLAKALEPLNASNAALSKQLESAQQQIQKLEAQPAPARISLRAISKAEDKHAQDDLKKVEATPIVDDIGEKHEAAGLIKSLHKTGGAALRK